MSDRARAKIFDPMRAHEAAPTKLAYRVHEAADTLSIGVSTLWRRIAEKKIATKKEGGNTLILRSDVISICYAYMVADRVSVYFALA